MSNVWIFTSFPFVIFLLITPFLLRASSCSSSSSHFLTYPWRNDSSHLLAPIVCVSELLTTSASISSLSLKHITSLPWNGSYHPHNSGAHTERADPTSLNLCWKPLRAPMKETEYPTKGSILRGNDKMDQGGGQMQIRKEMWITQCRCANPCMQQRGETGFGFSGEGGRQRPLARWLEAFSLPVYTLISMSSSVLSSVRSEDRFYLPLSYLAIFF